MVVQTAKEACNNALRQTQCTPGMCLANTRAWLDIPSQQFDAISAWINCPEEHRHPGEHGPAGSPQFWRGGSSLHGHIDLSLGPKSERTTDAPDPGIVSTVPHGYVQNVWGQEFMGWTSYLNGVVIPYLIKPERDWRDRGNVRVRHLQHSPDHSLSVSRLRYRLNKHQDIPERMKPKLLDPMADDGTFYGPQVVAAVRYWQRQVLDKQAPGPRDGSSVSNVQANILFGPAYVVIEEK